MNADAKAVWVRWGLAALALCLAVWVEGVRPDAVSRLDEVLRDALVRWQASSVPEDRVVVVDIDDESLRSLGPWPWPRERVADLVETLLGESGARAVALDLVLPQASGSAGDLRLATLAEHAPLALAQVLDYTPRTPALSQGELAGGRVPTLPALDSVPAHGHIANHAMFAQARCVGNIGYVPDPDGVLRRLPVQTWFEGRVYHGLAQALLHCAGDSAGTAAVSIGGIGGLWRVPYRFEESAYAVWSAADILLGRVPKSVLQGRWVLVGSSALALGDQVSTPLSGLTAGVMVHAAAVSALLDAPVSPRVGRVWATWLVVVWCVVTVAWVAWLMSRVSAWVGFLALLAMSAAWLWWAAWGVSQQWEWSVTAPLWAYAVLAGLAVPFEWQMAQRRSRRVLSSMSHYVAQPVLHEIAQRDWQHSLEPRLCEVTVLIADMAGYTRTVSGLALTQAAQLTRDVLGCMTRPVMAGGATLDKYSGDGLVAFWGAPLDCPDQADRAVDAALDVLREIEVLNQRRRVAGEEPVAVRIGIESGRALVGDLGTEFRSTYTAVGDCINFASRLEAAAQGMGVWLLLGPETRAKLQRHTTREVGRMRLRDTDTELEVYTVCDDSVRVIEKPSGVVRA